MLKILLPHDQFFKPLTLTKELIWNGVSSHTFFQALLFGLLLLPRISEASKHFYFIGFALANHFDDTVSFLLILINHPRDL